MIDTLNNIEQLANMGSHFQKAIHFIKNTDLSQLESGKYPIDGENVFAVISEYETKGLEQGAWEAHRKYSDIQCIMVGQEKMGYCNVNEMVMKEDYNEENDIFFLEGQGDFFTVKEGMFAYFAPEDAHMPCISVNTPQNVKKLVVKVLIKE